MTTRQAMGIALKFFSIYLIFNVLALFPMLVVLVFRIGGVSGKLPSTLIQILVPAIGIIGCATAIGLIWKVSTSLLHQGSTEEEPVVNDMTTDGIMKMALSCMGLYYAIGAVLHVLETYTGALAVAQQSRTGLQVDISHLVVPIIQFAIGCVLIAKPRQWARAIKSIGEK